MKTYLSVFMLYARSTIYRLIVLLITMAVVESVLFGLALQEHAALEEIFTQSRISWVCAVCFVLLTVFLFMTSCEHGGNARSTLRRLQISERAVFVCRAINHTICYGIFWAVQVLLILGLFQYYITIADASYVGSQSIFLAFYRNNFLHSLLPLEEISRYVRNGILMVCLGMTAAYYPLRQRGKKAAVEMIVLVCVVLPFFASSMGAFSIDIFLSIAATLVAIKVIFGVFQEEEPYET